MKLFSLWVQPWQYATKKIRDKSEQPQINRQFLNNAIGGETNYKYNGVISIFPSNFSRNYISKRVRNNLKL